MSEVQTDFGAFFAEAAAAGRELAPDLAAVTPLVTVPLAALQEALGRGEPVVLLAPPHVPPADFAAAFRRLAAVVERHQPDLSAEVGAALAAVAVADEAALGDLIGAVLRGDTEVLLEWAGARQVTPERLYLVAELAARPFLHAYARSLEGRVDLARWRERYCPVCGRRPNMAVIDGENLKHLHCPGCASRWPTRRFQCSLCGHDDRGTLHFLTVEEWPGWRIETCNRCQGYMKVLDEREPGTWAPDLDLFVADGRSAVLDLVAQQRGYRKPEIAGSNWGE